MGEVFKPGESKRRKIEKLAEELGISEGKAKKLLEKRGIDELEDEEDIE